MIDSYSFGSITVHGKIYTQDVVVYPDRVESSWWRKSGHNLSLEDIQEVLSYGPEMLVVGTGESGMMNVSGSVQEEIRKRGVQLFVARTEEAVKKYNEVSGSKKAVAALHLTC